jgi:hypothetical protein
VKNDETFILSKLSNSICRLLFYYLFSLANWCASNQKSVHHANAMYYYKNSKNVIWQINKEKEAIGFLTEVQHNVSLA